MTIAEILAICELLDNELETGTGEDDEDRTITALNVAQDYFETVCAAFPKMFATRGTVATVASTEVSTYPTDLLRLDALWHLDTSSRPTTMVERVFQTGGHAPSAAWPFRFAYGSASGDPARYWTDANEIYWDPLPDAVYTKRVYGLYAKAAIALRTGTFAYPESAALPLATFACRLLAIGVGDDTEELTALAGEIFTPLLRSRRKFSRERPGGRVYSQIHTT